MTKVQIQACSNLSTGTREYLRQEHSHRISLLSALVIEALTTTLAINRGGKRLDCRGGWEPSVRRLRRVLRVQVSCDRPHHHCNRCSRCHRALPGTSRAVVAEAKHFSPVVSRKTPLRNTFGPQAKHNLPTCETSDLVPKPCPAGASRPGPYAPGQGLQATGRAGATPQETALACTAGPFREVAPEIFPCRKAAG